MMSFTLLSLLLKKDLKVIITTIFVILLGEMTCDNIEIAFVDEKRVFTVLKPSEIKDYLD